MPSAATFSSGKAQPAAQSEGSNEFGLATRLLNAIALLIKNILFWGSILMTGYGLFSVANLAMNG